MVRMLGDLAIPVGRKMGAAHVSRRWSTLPQSMFASHLARRCGAKMKTAPIFPDSRPDDTRKAHKDKDAVRGQIQREIFKIF